MGFGGFARIGGTLRVGLVSGAWVGGLRFFGFGLRGQELGVECLKLCPVRFQCYLSALKGQQRNFEQGGLRAAFAMETLRC